MAIADFHHGVRVTELTEGATTLRLVSTAIIGLVATASDADAAVLPLDTPVLFTSIAKAQAAAGTLGTLSTALAAIADHRGWSSCGCPMAKAPRPKVRRPTRPAWWWATSLAACAAAFRPCSMQKANSA